MTATEQQTCADELRRRFAAHGCEVTITTAPPLVITPYIESIQCPHGTTFYVEPTSDQIAAWARDGVR